MAEGGIIYTKTIDPSVQDGIDNNLIIQPNYAYQKKLEIGDDWNELTVGAYISYTYSETGENTVADNVTQSDYGRAENSGGTTNDTFTYFGLIKAQDQKYLPNCENIGFNSSNETIGTSSPLSSDQVFIGYAPCRISSISQPNINSSDTRWNCFSTVASGDAARATYLVNSNSNTTDIYCERAYSRTTTLHISPSGHSTTKFGAFWGFNISIQNRGTSSQTITLKSHSRHNFTTDISLTALKQQINSLSTPYHTKIFNHNDGANALPIPDSFFFYNAFLTIRPRIHSIAVKKIS
jgi:hypothetical protein